MGSMLAALALANPNFGTIEVVTTKYHDLNQCLAICTGVPGSENGHVKFGSSGGSQHGALGGGSGGHLEDPHHGAFGVRPFAEPTRYHSQDQHPTANMSHLKYQPMVKLERRRQSNRIAMVVTVLSTIMNLQIDLLLL